MKCADIHEAKRHFSALIADVEAGEEIVIAKGGAPVARLIPMAPPGKRMLGRDVGLPFKLDPDFDEYVPAEFDDSGPGDRAAIGHQ